jgi:hypothetical protein
VNATAAKNNPEFSSFKKCVKSVDLNIKSALFSLKIVVLL